MLDSEEVPDAGQDHFDRDGGQNHAHQALDGDEAAPLDEAREGGGEEQGGEEEGGGGG